MTDYGETLPLLGLAEGVGPCMDVQWDRGTLYAIQNRDMDDRRQGCLRVLSLKDPARPRLVGSWYGLGNSRQLVVRDGVAYVTARESGLFLIDVRDPTAPRLLCHYDTVEFATGLFVWEHLAFVACRQYGVEIIDVGNPEYPRHISLVRTGEAQSVDVCDSLLYAGVWGSCEVVICDVRRPERPVILSRAPLDGRGDGVFAQGGLCYAATAHHSRRAMAAAVDMKPDHPLHGTGNGFEILDVSDPERPAPLSVVKLNERYHNYFFDTWRVTVRSPYAFMSHSHNGCFIFDVSDPGRPAVVAHRRFPGPVCGLAVHGGYLYAADAEHGLTVLDARPWADAQALLPVERCGRPPQCIRRVEPEVPSPFSVYRADGQIRAVAFWKDCMVAACGRDGVHFLRDGRCERVLPTAGIACDVRIAGDLLYVAEDEAGLRIWRLDDPPILLGTYAVPGSCVKQVVVPDGRFALLHVGCTWVHGVDVRDPGHPVCRMTYMAPLGLLYGRNLCDQLVRGRYAAAFWHASGLRWFDLSGEAPVLAGELLERMSFFDGITAHRGQALLVQNGGLVYPDPEDPALPSALPKVTIPGVALQGKPAQSDTHLCLTHRAQGTIQLLRLERPDAPEMVGRWRIEGHPDTAALDAGRLAIPAGWQGLLYAKMGEVEAWARDAAARE